MLEGSRADVSFAVGLLVDKFCWHLPPYRQHQRLLAAGFKRSRQWLTQIVQQAGRLLEPIYEAQLDSIRASRVKAMDETPIKAGHAGPGKMSSAYYWQVYDEQDEVCFVYRESRRHEHADEVLGPARPGMVLLSDGYGAYKSWARKTGRCMPNAGCTPAASSSRPSRPPRRRRNTRCDQGACPAPFSCVPCACPAEACATSAAPRHG